MLSSNRGYMRYFGVWSLDVCSSDLYQKVVSSIEEVKARGGRVMAVVTEGDSGVARLADHTIAVPETLDLLTPVLTVLPLQLLAYYIAVRRGCNVDQPRNLAKSVTVEGGDRGTRKAERGTAV